MKKTLSLMLILALSGCAPTTTVKQKETMTIEKPKGMVALKRRIGVVDFENKTKYGENRLGTSASDILITELAKSGKFIVVERDKLHTLMAEQKLGMSGVVDSNTAAKVGKILGLNAVVTGSISQFGEETEGSEYLITQSKRQVVKCTVDIRVVDVETGQILYADSGSGLAKKHTGGVLGLGTRAGYDETLEGEALRAAIVKFVNNIVLQVEKKPWSCRVADVDGQNIYLNAGHDSGVPTGQILTVYHVGRAIKDPTSGLVIGNTEEKVGEVKVVRYFGDDGSVAELSSGSAPSAGDVARLKGE
ncbi:MAG: CsgG/HfaB family protein [Elusimicrobiota bacterium]|jgi:curli biogenesis system outer membrane secretion channel CsgG